jgi:hypothetical protein
MNMHHGAIVADCLLMWVNEGDSLQADFRTSPADAYQKFDALFVKGPDQPECRDWTSALDRVVELLEGWDRVTSVVQYDGYRMLDIELRLPEDAIPLANDVATLLDNLGFTVEPPVV